jgi:hypothetical protein
MRSAAVSLVLGALAAVHAMPSYTSGDCCL